MLEMFSSQTKFRTPCHLFLLPVSSRAVIAHLSHSRPSWSSQGDGKTTEFYTPSKFLFLSEYAVFASPLPDASEGNVNRTAYHVKRQHLGFVNGCGTGLSERVGDLGCFRTLTRVLGTHVKPLHGCQCWSGLDQVSQHLV